MLLERQQEAGVLMTASDVVLTTQTRSLLDPLLDIALDLCANLAAEDRYRRLIAAVRRIVPYDAASLLRLEGGVLVPVATAGLKPEVSRLSFVPAEHPRLERILAARGAVRFEDGRLPDPFDGLLLAGGEALREVHACMGCALRIEEQVIGALAVDALDPHAFDAVDEGMVATFAALAAAAMRTAGLIEALERSAARQGLVARQLFREAQERAGSEILGISAAAVRLREEVDLLARSDLTVLLSGETGVGKEVVARAIHAQSLRRGQALIHVNCAALPESIAESELFGHVRGAFTGATQTRAGKFEAADGGTLLLDEIGELALSIQPKLLRALQSGEVQRIGADRPVKVDVRVVAATNRDLAEEVRVGRFRADLYHRLSVYPLHVPPLRERPEDIDLLAGHFLDQARMRLGLGPVHLGAGARQALRAYEWPGNVRELEHVLQRAALRASRGRRLEPVEVGAEHLGLGPAGPAPAAQLAVESELDGLPLAEAVEEFRRRRVRQSLERAGGSWAEAARRLGMDRGNLHRLARRLGLLPR
jgi:anaerobic nitric oxide reductase transcription regulator